MNKSISAKNLLVSFLLLMILTITSNTLFAGEGDQPIEKKTSLFAGACDALVKSATKATETISTGVENVTQAEQYRDAFNSRIEEMKPFFQTIENQNTSDSEQVHNIILQEITMQTVPALVRIFTFELSPLTIIEEIVIPFLAIITEYTDDNQTSNQREARVATTLAIRSGETSLKVVKAGVFGVLPDPFSLVYDLAELGNNIDNSKDAEESLIKEVLGVVYAHLQKNILNTGLSHNERIAQLAELKPVLEQLSYLLSKRIDSFKEINSREDFERYLDVEIESFRLKHFGPLSDSYHVKALDEALNEAASQVPFGGLLSLFDSDKK